MKTIQFDNILLTTL